MLAFNGNVESFKQAKERAKLAAIELVILLSSHESIIVFAHGLMNRQIKKEHVKLDWFSHKEGRFYWSKIQLSKH